MSAADAHETLRALHAERDALHGAGVAVEDLDLRIRHAHEAWVGAVVTELATLRAQLGGPQVG